MAESDLNKIKVDLETMDVEKLNLLGFEHILPLWTMGYLFYPKTDEEQLKQRVLKILKKTGDDLWPLR